MIKATIATLEPYKTIVSSYNLENLIIKPWDQESLLVRFFFEKKIIFKEMENMFLNDEIDGMVIDVPTALKLSSKFPCTAHLFPTAISSFNYGFIYRNDLSTSFIQSVDTTLMKVKESVE